MSNKAQGGASGRARDPEFKTRLLLGDAALAKLHAARVMVIGLGGVGGACAEALARAGVGRLVLVDFDEVSATNLNRQAVARLSTVGKFKVDAACDLVRDVMPHVQAQPRRLRVDPDGVAELLADPYDFVVDAQDTVATKIALAAHCDRNGVPLISAMGTGNKLHPELFQIADIYQTSVCPLCKAVRKEARARGIGGLTVLYSREVPLEPLVPDVPGERGDRVGTVSWVPPVAGMMLAGHVVRTIAGFA